MVKTLFKVGDLIEHRYSEGCYIIVGTARTEDPTIQKCMFWFVSAISKQMVFCEFLDVELKQSCIKLNENAII